MAAAGMGALNQHMITWRGQTKNAKEWGAELGIAPQVLLTRVMRIESGDAAYSLDRAMNPAPMQRGWDKETGYRKRKPIREEMLQAFDVPYWADDWAWFVVESHIGEGITLDEIGQLYGVTRERIRQYEVSAMRKIRRYLALTGRAMGVRELLAEMDHVRASNQNALGSGGDEVAA